MSDARQRIETRKGVGILLIIVLGITPLFIPGMALAVVVAAAGGVLAGFVGGRSSAARVRYILAGALCGAGIQAGYRLMPVLADAGKYVNTIPAIVGGLPGAFAYFITREDAEAADTRWYDAEDATSRSTED